ncbi:hypothetical protein [Elizabethkingia meningoseptica]|uniref:hypothetical protein n=1 Tax=Elizabethkingia meningoseptica TaxID=238 RepID=UPI0022F14C98|nr:hypothetical protein [Elizabethkingia meningoseptica]EJK5328587.1 hypothetical protein [Elizabethkingia meningoseptica]MEC4710341.1 hypothetical protein [Elizabethkingia meningoseptica]WBS76439.1 hypothetical protein PF438_08105 [Elizabethkingia meningoseptica]
MMKKNYTLLFLLFFSTICFSQITNSYYPTGQEAYPGGENKLYKDLREAILKKNIEKCAKNEYLYVRLRIDKQGKPAFIKNDTNKRQIEQNPCAFNMVIQGLKGLSGWVAAKKGGISYDALYEFPFFPNDLLMDYNEDYSPSANTKMPEYEGGEDAFRRELSFLMNQYLGDMYHPVGVFKLSFLVDEKGKMSEFEINPRVENTEAFLKDINSVTRKMRNKWKPGEYKGVPIRSRHNIKINFLKD